MKNLVSRPFSGFFDLDSGRVWQAAFWISVVGYCLFYAPFGINETDGGFMTGYAWQILCGKTLYLDVLYVRPPLPVWLRALEIWLLPDGFETLGERWIFYLKIAGSSWLAADLLASGGRKWQLATLGFVVSAHNYAPMSMHTFDGIFFAVLGLWILPKNGWAAAICVFASMLCKQSFYPMAGVFLLAVFVQKGRLEGLKMGLILAVCWAIFIGYLRFFGIFENYQRLVGGSSEIEKAMHAGVLVYFRIHPMVAFGAAICLFPMLFFLKMRWQTRTISTAEKLAKIDFWKKWAGLGWAAFLVWLAVSFCIQIHGFQASFPPYHQARLLFWLAVIWLIFQSVSYSKSRVSNSVFSMPKMLLNQLTLLAVSWCASISWGYQLPVQFAMPGVFAAFCLTEKMDFHFSKKQKRVAGLAVWLLLLATFRYAHDFIYQDGRRSEMTVNLGQVFPQLSGIFSTAETLRTYQELKDLKARFAAPIAVLPIFGQADFLLKQRPVLPTNWAVNRETSHFNDLIYEALESKKPVVLMLKSYGNRIFNDPENSVSVDVLRQKTKIGETEFFWIYQ